MTVKTAYRDTDCEDCGTLIAQDDLIYFTDEGKLCYDCAARDKLVCPECSSQKKPDYARCYECGGRSPGSYEFSKGGTKVKRPIRN